MEVLLHQLLYALRITSLFLRLEHEYSQEPVRLWLLYERLDACFVLDPLVLLDQLGVLEEAADLVGRATAHAYLAYDRPHIQTGCTR